MMKILITGLAMAATTLTSSVALAGGFDRGGVNIDLLYAPESYVGEAGITYVFPDRTLKNVTRGVNLANPALPAASTASVGVDGDYFVPRFGVKFDLGQSTSCLATYSEPFGADADYGLNNAYSATAVEFKVDSEDVGLTCSYKFALPKGQFRVIAGLSYLWFEGTQARQTFADFAPFGTSVSISPLIPNINPQGLGTFELSDEALGWRVGAAYEIPEIALRASLVYNSKYELDGLSGTVDTTSLGGLGTINAVTASSEIPQSIELKVQSGIAPGYLAFGSLKWQQWSNLSTIPIVGVTSPVTGAPSPDIAFEPLYRDGYTASLGIGRAFNDELSGALSLGWDRGTSTISGSQTDTWSLSGGVSYKPTENIEISFGGLVGLLTGGTSLPTGGDAANNLTYSFDDDFVGALTASAKIKF